ncbi:autoinducer 2 ABC transporter substrate-binding protein [Siculibacillus lacustris]|uniref:Autoinducer 2 ABC transporter substrate-binding protein n=1 Tax=Siculibacillus lacustris TaxID=1549641 RepID=A0A4Q9VPF4_9HYPH|nr:autoinducer 2 ABC transporter substrate-binding protein [Siculibacillus lacustris]TBW37626.1 autoinducer 2 ABC transporter substrate-binding protein [Siculibacillus lacustris]
MLKKLLLTSSALALTVAVVGSVASAADTKYTIPTIVKISGIQWFDRMEQGVKKFAQATGMNAYQVGPPKADAQIQVQIIEDQIAKGVHALTVVPFSPEALEPVLKKARDKGIKVISHEAAGLKNVDYDLEAFSNAAYGEHFMKALAACMKEKGEYATFVGSLTSKSHNEWVDAAIAYQKKNYPNMKMVGSKNETFDDQQQAYAKTQELLRAFPNVRGFEGSASTDVAGIGLALEERGMSKDTCVVGTSLPSISTQYLETGAVDMISFWDPADAAYAMDTIAVDLLNGKKPAAGQDLKVPGYGKITIEGNVIYGQAWIDVTKENASKYPF